MEHIEIKVRDYIENTLQHELRNLLEVHPYLSFFLIASSIEFLGKCLSVEKDWHTCGDSQFDFETAIMKLTALSKYRQYTSQLKKTQIKDNTGKKREVYNNPTHSLYKSFRCGLLHASLPDSTIRLCEGDEEPKTLNGVLYLYLDTFYNDFRKACKELLNKKWPKKSKDDIFIIVTHDSDNRPSSGTTCS